MRTLLLVLGVASLQLGVSIQGQSQSRAAWQTSMTVVKSDPNYSVSPTEYRLYGPQNELRLILKFGNDDTRQIVVPSEFFENMAVTIETQDGRSVAIVGEWLSREHHALLGPASPISTGGSLILNQQDFISAEYVLRPDEGDFAIGSYRLAIDWAASEKSLKFGDLSQWSGQAPLVHETIITIEPIDDQASREAFFRREALEAYRRQDYSLAIQHWQQFRLLGPTDVVSAATGIGVAQLRLGHFREAANELEKALPFLVGAHSAIPYELARAHLALGNEQRAAEVLRLVVPEADVQRDLERLRGGL